MIYGSVCSGIEAATQAWNPLGWQAAFFSEIDKFPSAVLAHHYGSNMPGDDLSGNGIPNLGDMTDFERWPDYAIDVLVGGTPCQSFSVAGLRAGLADPRGNLMLTFGAIAQRYKPRWIVWENVPGVLSSNKGRDFGTFLRLLGECGYGFAYRVLDAQFVRVDRFGRAVPQRRRRVFVVGYLGDWRRAAAVLSEPEGMSGNPQPCRKAGEDTAGRADGGTASGSHWAGSGVHPSLNQSKNDGGIGLSNQEVFSQGGAGLVPDVANPLTARMHKGINTTADEGQTPLPIAFSFDTTQITSPENSARVGSEFPMHTLNAKAHVPKIAQAFKPSHFTRGKDGAPSDVFPPLSADADKGDQDPIVLTERGRNGSQNLEWRQDGTANAILTPNGGRGGFGVGAAAIQDGPQWAVRRLTPRECERLQGFPDDFTRIPWRNKAELDCPDGPRYKALGNSMAVNCMAWIGQRIEMIEQLCREPSDG